MSNILLDEMKKGPCRLAQARCDLLAVEGFDNEY